MLVMARYDSCSLRLVMAHARYGSLWLMLVMAHARYGILINLNCVNKNYYSNDYQNVFMFDNLLN